MNKINFSILDEIVAVANILEKSGFTEERLKLAKPHMKKLEKVIPVQSKALLYFCAMFRMCMSAKLNSLEINRTEKNLHNLGKFLGVDECYILHDYNIFDELFKKQLYVRNGCHAGDLFSYIVDEFIIQREVFLSVVQNKKIPKYVKTEEEVRKLLFRFLCNLHEKPIYEYMQLISQLEAEYNNIEFIKRCTGTIFDPFERVLFFHLVWKLTAENMDNNIKSLFSRSFEDWTSIVDHLTSEKCMLKRKGIIDVTPAEFMDDYEISLTKYGLELFYGDDACYYVPKKPSASNLILSENINEKELTYDTLVKEQLAFFENSMQHEQYNALRCRLRERNLPSGICALFYGMPGTGKTESVMQIARKTNRNVMHIDIAETKSCWYGESEKLIKKLFADYKKECAAARRAKLPIPILLFNEADAIISTRKSATFSNIAQTENAIQNIILENLESFDGIMIATTNLAENFDKAFERRFLFKVKFGKASTETSSKIWMSKLEKLSEEQAYELAHTYSFSGGEIDNISRKILMNEIITGEAVCFDEIKTFCQQEKLECAETKRIGFC